ncbi:MAG TPA: RNA-binding protein [Kofleriaceae bacterium]|jgi:RNA recognition motif-containing protein|nr:RNA-binding protein [Kofleriaceae bacterium]
MSNRLYVGNLPFHATEDLISQRVAQCGEVRGVDLILDRVTGRPRGFAFVEMATAEGMQKAIAELDGQNFEGRPLTVKVAEERRGSGGPRDNGGPRRGGGGDRGWGRGR